MKREKSLSSIIKLNLIFASVVSIVLTALLLIVILSNAFFDSFKDTVKGEAEFLANLVEVSHIPLTELELMTDTTESNRITIITSEGVVVYDSLVDETTLDNHIDRPEIVEAFTVGEGSRTRYSNTLGMKYYYYAVELGDGEAVLRVSTSTYAPIDLFLENKFEIIGVLFLLLLLVNGLSKGITKRIIQPFEGINLEQKIPEGMLYTEFDPFIRKINQQSLQIGRNIEQLQMRATTVETITQNMSEGLALFDKKGQVVSINRGFKQILGKGDRILLPQKMVYVTRNTDLLRASEAIMSEGNYSEIMELGGKYYHLMGGPIETGGGVLILSDVTAYEKASRKRREFSSNVSHELRTPLTSISGYAELLKLGFVPQDDVGKFGEKIHQESKRMMEMIENIMYLSSLDDLSDVEKKNFTEVSLSEVANHVADRLDFLAAQKDVEIITQCGYAQVRGNMEMLENLIYNLTENAIKYNKDGGTVTIFTSIQNGKPSISIQDTGVGIPPESVDRIFERFYRVDKARSSKTGGNGIGLAIVKHIADYHNAIINVESQLDYGTTIRIEF